MKSVGFEGVLGGYLLGVCATQWYVVHRWHLSWSALLGVVCCSVGGRAAVASSVAIRGAHAIELSAGASLGALCCLACYASLLLGCCVAAGAWRALCILCMAAAPLALDAALSLRPSSKLSSRLSSALASSLLHAACSSLLVCAPPLAFPSSPHLYVDWWRACATCLLCAANTASLLLSRLLCANYMRLLAHAKALGAWEPLPASSSGEPLPPWQPRKHWPLGSRVRHSGAAFVALTQCNTAEPGRIVPRVVNFFFASHQRPLVAYSVLYCVCGGVLGISTLLMVASSHWLSYASLALLSLPSAALIFLHRRKSALQLRELSKEK